MVKKIMEDARMHRKARNGDDYFFKKGIDLKYGK